MHPTKQHEVAKALRQIAATATEPVPGPLSGNFRIHDGVFYCLPPESVALHAEQVRAVLGSGDLSAKFTGEYLSKRLNGLIAKLLCDPAYELESGLHELLSECAQHDKVVTAYLPLEGVIWRLSEDLQVGGVTIKYCDEALLDEIWLQMNSVLAQSLGDETQKGLAAEVIRNELRAKLLGACVVRYCVNAEPDRAVERAKEEGRFAIDILRLASKVAYPILEDIRFGLDGERGRRDSIAVTVSDQAFQASSDRKGSLFSFELNGPLVAKLEELGLLALAKRRHDRDQSQMDVRLCRAIHWLSVGLAQDESESALIAMIVALECLFIRGEGQPIASSVAESAAFLLGRDGEGRRRIAAHVRGLYRSRGKLAHGGSVIVSPDDLAFVLSLVVVAICEILKRRDLLRSADDWSSWLDKVKYDGFDTSSNR